MSFCCSVTRVAWWNVMMRVSVLNQILQRADKGEYTTLTTLMGVILVLLLILPQITALFDAVKELVSF